MRISEIFHSVQGEGIYTGVPMVFIRFQGCTLGCSWCDSRYTWPETSKNSLGEMSTEQIISKVGLIAPLSTQWICITGGEPLEQLEDFKQIVHILYRNYFAIEVETSGLIKLPEGDTFNVVRSWIPDLKCPSANANKSPVFEDLGRLRPQDQLKCVVSSPRDLEFVSKILTEYPTRATILISPVLNPTLEPNWANTCVEYCKNNGYRLSLQTHKFIWGAKRGV